MEENGFGKIIGNYQTNKGCYECYFIKKDITANAWGPLSTEFVTRTFCCPAFSVSAESEEEAREKLAKVIGAGNWI